VEALTVMLTEAPRGEVAGMGIIMVIITVMGVVITGLTGRMDRMGIEFNS
jgi:hypothetical protein